MATKAQCQCYKSKQELHVRCPHHATPPDYQYCGIHKKTCQVDQIKFKPSQTTEIETEIEIETGKKNPTKTMVPYIKTKEPCFATRQGYEERRQNVMSDENYFYKVVDLDSVEFLCLHQLHGTGLTPKVFLYKECIHEGLPSILIKMEKYDGDLSDYIDTNPTLEELTQSLQEIIDKSLQLNLIHKIRHGDFHMGNIVYKKMPQGSLKWAFIDFELSAIYDHNDQLLKVTAKDSAEIRHHYQYNPLYDLINLESNLMTSENYLVLRTKKSSLLQKYRDHYLSTMGDAEMEMQHEIDEHKVNLKPIILTLDLP